tara:strand:- start:922 stop:1296 length:375 start_codon:yes stop_codon:yes gene_type:complete
MVNYKSLIGRQWEYGIFDCYSIVRDYYGLLGINLPDYERPENVETCKSIFLNDANKLNFKEININDRKPNDVLIMKIWTKEPMHGAVLLENDMILHQKQKSLSCVEYYNHYYRKRTVGCFRYAA